MPTATSSPPNPSGIERKHRPALSATLGGVHTRPPTEAGGDSYFRGLEDEDKHRGQLSLIAIPPSMPDRRDHLNIVSLKTEIRLHAR